MQGEAPENTLSSWSRFFRRLRIVDLVGQFAAYLWNDLIFELRRQCRFALAEAYYRRIDYYNEVGLSTIRQTKSQKSSGVLEVLGRQHTQHPAHQRT